MAFEWDKFLEQNRIEVKQSGSNVSRGHVAIHCPFCGPNDPSYHMSVNLQGKGWRCWRHPDHRGKHPARLVAALIGVSMERAHEIVGSSKFIPDDFLARVRQHVTPPPPVATRTLKFPAEFKSFHTWLPSGRPYRMYLRDRGFDEPMIERLSKRNDVFYCTRGAYRGRIIFCVYYENELISWTGRTISRDEELRYRTLSVEEERAEREGYSAAIGAISHYLLWYDDLINSDADTLLLVEGPFDALKIDMLGRHHGVRATCFFTSSPTDAQVQLLHTICPQFKRRVLLLDRGTYATGIRIARGLSTLGIKSRTIPDGLKDPGEFTPRSFDDFMLALDKGTR